MKLPKTVSGLTEERQASVVANATVMGGEVHMHDTFAIDEKGQRITEADREVPVKDMENLVKSVFAEHYPHDEGPGELHVRVEPNGDVNVQYYSEHEDELKHRRISGPTE